MEATGAPAPSATGVDRDEESAPGIRRRLVKRAKAGDTQTAQLLGRLSTAQQAAMGTGELCPVSRALRCRVRSMPPELTGGRCPAGRRPCC